MTTAAERTPATTAVPTNAASALLRTAISWWKGPSASARPVSRGVSARAFPPIWCSSRLRRTLSSSASIAIPARARAPGTFQLYFLFQRAQQLAALKQQDLFAPVRVADYLIDKDKLFAKVTLEEAEYSLYEQVSAKLDIQAPKPDLVIYLQAPVDVLLERIARRGIGYEQQIGRDYLERLNEAYARFFHEYEGAPLLIVNAASIDPVNNQSDYDELAAAVNRMKRGRLYYNPLRHASI